MQECRKYKKDNWLGVEEVEQIDKFMKQLVIESQSNFTQKLCREIYKHSTVAQILRPFGRRDSQGHWQEMDHGHVRCATFDGCTIPDLVSFLSGRGVLFANEYSYLSLIHI